MTDQPPTTTTDASHPDAQPVREPVEASDDRTDRVRDPNALDATGLETLVRDGEPVAATCPYCDRPFGTREAYDLHVGDVHVDVCTTVEREAYADALADEEDELFYFHLRVVAALAGLYTVVTLLYMVALGSGLL